MTAHPYVSRLIESKRRPDYARLLEIDWTFSGAKTRGDTHAIHPYPAKFIPQIPRAMIALLHPADSTAVMDPFCGSGTSLVEAAVVGLPSIGIDVNPLACLISKVKVTRLVRSLKLAASRAAARAEEIDPPMPKIPGIDHWFKVDIQRALAALVASINEEPDSDVRDALKVALSSIIVRVSNQDSDTRYAAVEKTVVSEDVVAFFLRAAESIDRALAATWDGLYAPAQATVLERDSLEVKPEEIKTPVSLVVTSPPYPNAYEYWLYHKYRMYWLGLDPVPVKEKEIGARPHFFKKNPHTAEDFEHQMEKVLSLLAQVMVRGGHAVFQVGTSVIRGEVVDNAILIRNAASRQGFVLAAELSRAIPPTRKAFNLNHSRIDAEELLVFRLESA